MKLFDSLESVVTLQSLIMNGSFGSRTVNIETFFSDLYRFEVCHLRCACKLMVVKVVKKTQLLC